MRSRLISKALNERFRALCAERIARLAPEHYGELEPFVFQVRESLRNASPRSLNESAAFGVPGGWAESDADCLFSLRSLSMGQALQLHPGQHPSVASFLAALTTARADPERRFQLLAERYSCPLNFSLPAEDEAREYVLTRLMSPERARVEKRSIEAVNSDELLLKLNLVAVHAVCVPDLRFLDALNYYYELLPAAWQPRAQRGALLASYFALYARALATRI